MTARVRWFVSALLVAIVAMAARPTEAQYFGRNKVQYKHLSFDVLRTEHFDVYFYASERPAAELAARMAERWYARFAQLLTHQLTSRQPLILYASHPDFEQTNAIEGEIGEGTGGVTEFLKRRIVLPLGGPLAETDHVIGHELVHAFQFDMTSLSPVRRQGDTGSGFERLPLWFVEGMAEYLSLGSVDANTAMWMRDAASRDRMPTLHELAAAKFFPYRWGHSFWAYVTGRWGDNIVAPLLRNAAANGDAEVAIATVLGQSSGELSKAWHAALRENAATVRERTRPVTEYGQVLQKDRGRLPGFSVSPALSPDGRRLMFLSQRDLFSVDLFLADGRTGRVTRKVVNTAVDPRFSSLQFVNSAGAWSPDGRRFVFSAVHGGRPALVVFDVESNGVEREFPFPDYGEVFSPAWSPDGRTIAFSALDGGVTDLVLFDLHDRKTRRMTEDAFADLQPAWSPDGRTLAFVTDRYSTRLSDLAIGNYQVALMDVATGQTRPLEGAGEGKNINPQWTSDASIVFVSDRGGISNIFRADVAGGPAAQVTSLGTGVTGITAVSPAISYAAGARRLAFSVYEDGRYNIYAIESGDVLVGRPAAAVAGLDAATLPPVQRAGELMATLHRNAAIGQASAQHAKAEPYRARLALDLIGQPTLTAGVGSYGAFAGGGMSLFWSDALGDYGLGAAVEVSHSFGGGFSDVLRNTGAQAAFQSRKHRWNWTVAGGQVPYLAGAYALGLTTVEGRTVGVEQQIISRQVERSVSAVAAYPFTRMDRFEVAGGFSNLTFDQQVLTRLFDPGTLAILGEENLTLTTSPALNLGQVSAAIVHDTSVFGATSPVAGQSYRLQVSPTFGSLRFDSVLADYRRYVMPVPFYTLAARVLHFGRYGRDGEDPRLIPLYLGYPNLVRGYDFASFDASECTPTATGSCEAIERLFGSRMLVANLEFRFPLLRPAGVRPGMYGPVPIELAVFADAGVAWKSGEAPRAFGGERQGVSSAGITIRANLFGVVIAQFDFARPLQRPGRGWIFSFNLTPGF